MKTILVIEDDRTLRENICDLLREEGYNVVNADDGLTGLQQAMKHLPDLILCDIMMPKMNGYDFYKTIQQIKATSAIPLIFLTAKVEKEDIRAGMHLGADDYITKPFDFNEILLTIRSRLDKYEKIQQRTDEKFFALIDNPLAGVFIHSRNNFEFMNEKCAGIFGLRPHQIHGLSFKDLVAEEEKCHVLEKVERCFSKIQNSLHVKFNARLNKGNKKAVTVEVYAGIVNYKDAESLIGNMVECTSQGSKMVFRDEKDQSAEKISKKELNILKLICQGMTNAEISQFVGRSKRTVETQRASLLNKTGVKNTADLVIYAIRNGLL